jgi:hypothetical protein
MSDHARNYVKHLDNVRLRPTQKSLLFFLADYHNVDHASAWPSLQTLAADTGLSLRYIRRLVEQCVELRLIIYEPGLGRGNKSRFLFVELDLTVVQPKGEQNQGRKGGRKGGQKGGLDDSVIRNEPEPKPEPRTKDHHTRSALKAWFRVKEQLRSELPSDEWDLWVRPTYMLHLLDHQFLLLAMPPSGVIMRAANVRKPMVKAMLARYGYSFGFTKYPDEYERSQLESLGWELPPKRKPRSEVAV